jgi:signal peptide peptidase SppA
MKETTMTRFGNFEVIALAEERLGQLEPILAFTAHQREQALAAAPANNSPAFIRAANVAVVPVRGILLDEWSPAGPKWGATGYNFIRNAVADARADSAIKVTVLDIDSPGGLVSGMAETAAVIERSTIMRTGKPVIAVIRSYGASAAYALACCADHVVASDSSIVGSIGARLVHVSIEKALDEAGIRVTEIASHPGKADGSPFRDLSPTARVRLQASVDDSAAAFAQLVARNRKLTIAAVNDLDAQVFPARSASGQRTALGVGLVDAVLAADDALVEIGRMSRDAPTVTGRTSGSHSLLAGKSAEVRAGNRMAPVHSEVRSDEQRDAISDMWDRAHAAATPVRSQAPLGVFEQAAANLRERYSKQKGI